uniref:Rad50 n=1 Tax=Thermotoga maritima TaxID=2336 RepID=UPI0002074F20|nr:Chain A, Rad50 [Thermotoga maritima]3QF7_B Chain B, Rad50 [Thermotoga maritima]4W9M_C Chain C, Probable DNA double-strand break repair Rad50 ATPase,Probable DNA double-strand break repair Rad50 ATPase [Thermotoga maritima MSB8]4W9M_E Chain E, Probable DNA double-strand break repair Rad50 ATPase,Probable DNA double-strand break repair Rad50 ATPase [Thermotoga maritima MSB8]4W9M_I Chain I, Probable DNA double-strand break repair Rad50 ATPase,Probable DNA double-strand break repair Rad50 ATPase
MRPERLTVRNFLGLKNVDIEFQSGITVVEGPNGAGKSSLFEAISFALFGNGIRYPNSYDYVNRNAVDGTARLVFQFERGGKRYEIIREINALQRKHNAKLSEILENGKKAAIAAKPTSVKQEVEKILGIEHRTFIRTVFLPQGEIDKLLISPPSEITEIISDVFQSKETLEKLEKLLKEKMKKLENEISSGGAGGAGGSLEKKLKEMSDEYNNLDLLRKYLFDKSNFSRYFTGRVLEAVLKRTKAYLDILTNGRFDIDFDDEKGGFIIKDWGIERPARGLSGGERALISISLAMSLAEVASGRLDAFFIDEGFSSLDTENKEKIASVLKELERLNKVIVFITHDREFSEAFDRKLRITGGVVVNE